jgi:hypothetical protein
VVSRPTGSVLKTTCTRNRVFARAGGKEAARQGQDDTCIHGVRGKIHPQEAWVAPPPSGTGCGCAPAHRPPTPPTLDVIHAGQPQPRVGLHVEGFQHMHSAAASAARTREGRLGNALPSAGSQGCSQGFPPAERGEVVARLNPSAPPTTHTHTHTHSQRAAGKVTWEECKELIPRR